jgi:nicotinate-nucleotide pyrophosphorylase (carboxylating)
MQEDADTLINALKFPFFLEVSGEKVLITDINFNVLADLTTIIGFYAVSDDYDKSQAVLDKKSKVHIIVQDGKKFKKGQVLATLHGSVASVLGAERLILNLLTHLSGVATLTNSYVKKIKGTGAGIYDTRKTTPLWRDLEKYAVVCGGGKNHRFSLKDAILVKDNQHMILSDLKLSYEKVFNPEKLKKIRKNLKFIAFEAVDYRQVWQAIKCQADLILLDNMAPNQIKGSLVLIRAAREALGTKKPLVEISGGVNLKNVRSLAQLGVDRISVGAITHSAPAIDLSLEAVK